MNQNSGEHYHGQHAAKRSPIPMIVAAVVALGLIVALAVGVWNVLKSGGESARPTGSASASKSTSTKSPESDGKTVETVKEHLYRIKNSLKGLYVHNIASWQKLVGGNLRISALNALARNRSNLWKKHVSGQKSLFYFFSYLAVVLYHRSLRCLRELHKL